MNIKEQKEFKKEVEVRGHLIDSMILTRIFDKIMDLEGEFEVITFKIGKKKHDYSYAKLIIIGKNKFHLDSILNEVFRLGAIPVKIEEVTLKRAPSNYVLPENFYSTSNHSTLIYFKGEWIHVEDQMMDKSIVFYPNSKIARCVAIRDIRKGDLVIVGESGIRVVPPERPREGTGVFQFMSSNISTEKPVASITKKIANDISLIKKRKGKIVIVAGPAIIHTNATSALAYMIKKGYVNVLLAGNALAVHDVENALYGTSLGVDTKVGSSSLIGYKNHMYAINTIFKSCSLKKSILNGLVKSGIFYECIMNKVPYYLAGSIRDDGPIPDAITDNVKAQRLYKKALKNADMVIMLCTTLHSIAVGNMLPSDIKVIVVDINPSTVTKLLDRGTSHATGIVSDIGSFLPLLVSFLKNNT
jgi:lysine-ketoglutarate reductase/saccharopine dehydrogenase-like protein (TIGR00300 family)